MMTNKHIGQARQTVTTSFHSHTQFCVPDARHGPKMAEAALNAGMKHC